jgi:type II secretory pathway pseudopilin PulG
MQKGKEKGSILVLTVISVLILSIIVMGLLTVGTTEIQTTQNFHLNKAAYYTALEGVEEVRNMIGYPTDSSGPDTLLMYPSATKKVESFDTGIDGRKFANLGITRSYVTGNLKDFQDETPQAPVPFSPPQRGTGLGTKVKFETILWKVSITAEAAMGNRKGYSEIVAGIKDIAPTGY